jgi:hypothetical protein
MKKYPVLEMLAAAVSAFELNGSVIREAQFKREGDKLVDVYPNRVLIMSYLQRDKPSAIPLRVEFTVTDAHRERAEEVAQAIQHTVLMQTLKGKTDTFLDQVNNTLLHSEVNYREAGIVAWAPKIVSDYQHKEEVAQKSAMHERTSNFFGRIGEKVAVNFTVIEKKPFPRVESFLVYGHDDYGNLVSYWTRKGDQVKDGKITGRVKDHLVDNHRNRARVTVLNFVKHV